MLLAYLQRELVHIDLGFIDDRHAEIERNVELVAVDIYDRVGLTDQFLVCRRADRGLLIGSQKAVDLKIRQFAAADIL